MLTATDVRTSITAKIKEVFHYNAAQRRTSMCSSSGVPRNLSWGCTPKSLGSEYKHSTQAGFLIVAQGTMRQS